jgi:hypothetical protein
MDNVLNYFKLVYQKKIKDDISTILIALHDDE